MPELGILMDAFLMVSAKKVDFLETFGQICLGNKKDQPPDIITDPHLQPLSEAKMLSFNPDQDANSN